MPADQIFKLLRRACDQITDREVPDREIRSAINSKGGTGLRWPVPHPLFQQEIAANYSWPLERLKQQASFLNASPAFWVSRLFEQQQLICFAMNRYNSQTVSTKEAVLILGRFQAEFIVPSPMASPAGLNQEGKLSPRTLDNCGQRKYLVVEFDHASLQNQANFHKFLATQAHLVLLLWSGGKSIHGWYETNHFERFFQLACRLGADPKTWSPAQLVRMPGGLNNETGKVQKVLFSCEKILENS